MIFSRFLLDTPSIDSVHYQLMVYTLGVISIFLGYQSKKREVEAFLNELHMLLGRPDFNPDSDLLLVKNSKQGADTVFSTRYTLLDLGYDAEDVVDRLKELNVEEYSETKIDADDTNPPTLFVFGKDINGKLVYVKLKIREQHRQVVCVSFHYAKEKMSFPYA